MRSLSLAPLLALLAAASPAQDLLQQQRREEARRHYRAGEEYMRSEAFEEAAAEFKKATEKDPVFTRAFYGLGQARMALKQYAGAVVAYTSCRDLILREASIDGRARWQMDRQRRDDRLNVMKDQLGRENRGGVQVPAEVSLGLGSAYFRLNQIHEAERYYRAALSVDGKLGEAHNNLAVIYMLTGRLEEAERAMKAAEMAGFTVKSQFKQDLKQRMSTKTKQ
jgi:tetratricopeptide (TPR) repeat protein